MDPTLIGLIGTGGGGALKGLAGLFDHSVEDQAAIMRREADIRQSALEETMRRTEGQQAQVLSSTKARMAGTGFATDSGSFDKYLTGMAAEFQKQNDFTRKNTMDSIEMERGAADLMTENLDWKKGIAFAGDVIGTVGKMLPFL